MHTVVQLWPSMPIFHSRRPAAVQTSSVDRAMLLKPISPAATTSGWLMYVPAVQLMQAEAPVDAMYVPAGHNEQVVADADVAPVCPYLPVEQRLPAQVDEEVAAEYVPAAQSMQVDCPASAYLPAAQLMQVAELVCPVAPEYLPAVQSTHPVNKSTDSTWEYVRDPARY